MDLLSQEEVDKLLSGLYDEEILPNRPFYFYIRNKKSNKFSLIKINNKKIKKLFKKDENISFREISMWFDKFGYEVISFSQEKKIIIKEIKGRYLKLLSKQPEFESLEILINAHPEYLI